MSLGRLIEQFGSVKREFFKNEYLVRQCTDEYSNGKRVSSCNSEGVKECSSKVSMS